MYPFFSVYTINYAKHQPLNRMIRIASVDLSSNDNKKIR